MDTTQDPKHPTLSLNRNFPFFFSLKYLKYVIFLTFLSLVACSRPSRLVSTRDGFPKEIPDISKIPDAKPKVERLSKYGNPPVYQIGKTKYRVMKSRLCNLCCSS